MSVEKDDEACVSEEAEAGVVITLSASDILKQS